MMWIFILHDKKSGRRIIYGLALNSPSPSSAYGIVLKCVLSLFQNAITGKHINTETIIYLFLLATFFCNRENIFLSQFFSQKYLSWIKSEYKNIRV